MSLLSQEEILQRASELLEKDDGLKRALEVFQMSQDVYLRALTATNSVVIYYDDKTTPDQTPLADVNENLG